MATRRDTGQNGTSFPIGALPALVGKALHLDQIVDARRALESNQAGGKIVGLP